MVQFDGRTSLDIDFEGLLSQLQFMFYASCFTLAAQNISIQLPVPASLLFFIITIISLKLQAKIKPLFLFLAMVSITATEK